MKILIVVPARYQSTRFPGKPLALIGGVSMIVRTCRQAAKTGAEVVVATDDDRIAAEAERNGFRAVMTPSDCPSGTDRVYRAFIAGGYEDKGIDVIVNVQGDEPFISPEQISELTNLFSDMEVNIATQVRRHSPSETETLRDPNLVKVVTALNGDALYFSRSLVPYDRAGRENPDAPEAPYLSHVGIYAYRPEALKLVTSLPQSPLERTEKLEQLRWLQNGLKIRTAVTSHRSIGIDTPEDLQNAEALLPRS